MSSSSLNYFKQYITRSTYVSKHILNVYKLGLLHSILPFLVCKTVCCIVDIDEVQYTCRLYTIVYQNSTKEIVLILMSLSYIPYHLIIFMMTRQCWFFSLLQITLFYKVKDILPLPPFSHMICCFFAFCSTGYTQSGNGRFLTYIPSWWKNLPRLVRAGDARPPPFTVFTITYKVAVCRPTPLFSVVCSTQTKRQSMVVLCLTFISLTGHTFAGFCYKKFNNGCQSVRSTIWPHALSVLDYSMSNEDFCPCLAWNSSVSNNIFAYFFLQATTVNRSFAHVSHLDFWEMSGFEPRQLPYNSQVLYQQCCPSLSRLT